MQLTIGKDSLKEFLKIIDIYIDDSSALHLQAIEDRQEATLFVDTANGYTEVTVNALVLEAGLSSISAKLFKKLVAANPCNLEIATHKNGLRILADRAAYTLPTLAGQAPKKRIYSDWLLVDCSLVTDGIAKASLSSASGFFDWRDTVIFSIEGNAFRFFSSDGHRLYELEHLSEGTYEKRYSAMIPKASCKAIQTFNYFEWIGFTKGSIYLKSDTLIGAYPLAASDMPSLSIDNIFNKEYYLEDQVSVAADRLVASIKRLAAISSKNDYKRITIDLAPNLMMLSYSDKEDISIQCQDMIPVLYTGAKFTYSLNRSYLLDVIEQLSGGTIGLCLPREITHPMIFSSSNSTARAAILGMI